jgi:protoheme IX farnesyltransferase
MAISIYLAQDYGSAKIHVYPNEFGLLMTRWAILLLTVVLAAVSWFPVYADLQNSTGYIVSCVLLNVLFLLSAIKLLTLQYEKEVEIKYWAKFYFFGSIIYLPLILLALIFLK